MPDPHPYGSPELHPKLQPPSGPAGPTPPQYSPDGRFWWNGHQWVPAATPVYVVGQSHTGRNVAIGCGIAAVVIIGLILASAALFFGAAGTAINHAVAAPSANANCSPQPCAEKDGFTVTVSSVDRSLQGTGPFVTPSAGDHYVLVNVTATNHSGQAQSFQPFEFGLIDSTGIKRTVAFIPSSQCDLWSGVQIEPGSSYGPKPLCFEVAGPVNGSLKLAWTPFLANEVDLALP